MPANFATRFYVLTAIVAAFVFPTQLLAEIIPPIGLAPGTKYQLIFVTADTTVATSADINYYNTFVKSEAALNPSVPSTTWNAVAATPTIAANVNAPSTGLPVYNTQGQEVASAATGLYTPTLVNSISFDQFGNLGPEISTTLIAKAVGGMAPEVWTGTYSTGELNSDGLGSSFFQPARSPVGLFTEANQKWANDVIEPEAETTLLPLYALSSPITFVPEPATPILLASAFLMIGGRCLLRWRRRTSG